MAGGILVRADGDERMGIGHVMRCVALVEALTSGVKRQVVWLGHCPSVELRRPIEASGARFEPLAARSPDPGDLPHTLARISSVRERETSGGPCWVVLDGYHFDDAYARSVRAAAGRLLVVDDGGRWPSYPADVVVNPGPQGPTLPYRHDGATLLLGTRYALLRSAFRPARPPRVPAVARRLLVTMGGADPANFSAVVLEAVGQIRVDGLEVRLVVGPENPRATALCEAAARSKAQVRVLRSVNDMAAQMRWAEVALTAAGGTCWELASLGVAMLTVALAENQRPVQRALDEADAAVPLAQTDDGLPSGLARVVERLCHDEQRRRRLAECAGELVDGRGAQRVVDVVEALDSRHIPPGLVVRPVMGHDILGLWHLANDRAVRLRSLSTEPIALEAHREWFAQTVSDPGTRLWVADWDGLVVGQVRYVCREAGIGEISVAVVGGFKRRGLATHLIASTLAAATEALGLEMIRAVVRRGNKASLQTFERLGFARLRREARKGVDCWILQRSAGEMERLQCHGGRSD